MYLAHHELGSDLMIIVNGLHSCMFPDRFDAVLFCVLAYVCRLHTASVGNYTGASDVWKHCTADPEPKT